MRDLLANSAAWLAQQQARHAARRMTYQRGTSSISVSATAGTSRFDITDAEGIQTRVETLDLIIPSAELWIDAQKVEPVVGDRIHDGELGAALQYEVMDMPGEPPWRYTDAHRQQIRVHVKQVKDERPEPR